MHADSSVVSYFYDGLGRRALKMTGGGASTRFAYGLGGERLAEAAYGQDGQLQPGAARTEHVWLDGMPIAVVKGGQIRYVHADHLGTPRLITDAGGTPVWRWGGGPFGDAPADEDPDGDGVPFTYNLRFPGQYFDAETGLHYNMARYYDPATGRYREADPIGLAGGVNVYSYVGSSPANFVDHFGFRPEIDRYQTIDNAGYQAIMDVIQKSIDENKEYGGTIYKNSDGTYSYTEPNIGKYDTVIIPFLSGPQPVAGWYHTHGNSIGYSEKENENFSSDDQELTDWQKVPGYLGTPSGKIKKYLPSKQCPLKRKNGVILNGP